MDKQTCARPAEPEIGHDVWYRGWECGYDVDAALWIGEGWRAYKGGVDIDVPSTSAKTFDALLDEIDAEEGGEVCEAGQDDEGFYDDCGRWWPSNAEWCDRCQGMGTEECMCAGDFCCCGAGDNLECRRCHGEGYYILTPAMKKEREETARWWRDLNASLVSHTPTKEQQS